MLCFRSRATRLNYKTICQEILPAIRKTATASPSPIKRHHGGITTKRAFCATHTTKMRLPYAPTTPADPTPENQAIYDRIAARRQPRPLIPLDLALLHNPAIADGYNSLVGAIRTKSSLSQGIMELSICYIAVLTNAVYEWKAHSVLALKGGVSQEKLAKLLETSREKRGMDGSGKKVWEWEGFEEVERAVLEFTEQSTLDVAVEDKAFEEARRLLGTDQKVVELQITIGTYNMVSRFLVGLDVTENNGGKMVVPEMPA